MAGVIQNLKEAVLEVFFPRICLGCGREEGQYICKDCELFLSEAPPSKEVMSVWQYEGIVEKAIEAVKFRGYYDIVNELVEKALEKIDLDLPENTIITYVPMWPAKERQRGFNQAELIARKLGDLLCQVKHKRFKVTALLKKVRDNRTQVGLGPKERAENVKGAFQFCNKLSLLQRPTNVLLVDDVYTTGATARECVRVLKKAGIKNVFIFTLSRKTSL